MTWCGPGWPTARPTRPPPLPSRAAISGLRELSTPYHLAHGLLDQAQYLTARADAEAAEQAIAEARGIAERLGCQPLLDRAAGITPARPRSRA